MLKKEFFWMWGFTQWNGQFLSVSLLVRIMYIMLNYMWRVPRS